MEDVKEKYLGKKVELIKGARYHYSPRAMEDGPEFEIVIGKKLIKPEIGTEGIVIAIGRHRFDKSRILVTIESQEGENFLVNLDEVSLIPKPLLIVGTKVIHNTLIYWIEYQDESVRTTFQGNSQEFKAKNGVKIFSNCLPCLSKNGIATIRGKDRDHDLNIDKVELYSQSEAKDLENRVQEAVKEFNEAGGFGGFEKPLPEIELKGVDPKWKYCAMDESENIFVYDVIPVDGVTCWRTDAASFENTRVLKQTQFEEMKKLPWKESLHKIKHI